MLKLMAKFQHIREEDYWIFPISFFNVLFVTLALYASVLLFRGPAVVLAFLGIWFTSNKIRHDYSDARARFHIATTIIMAIILALSIHFLTN